MDIKGHADNVLCCLFFKGKRKPKRSNMLLSNEVISFSAKSGILLQFLFPRNYSLKN